MASSGEAVACDFEKPAHAQGHCPLVVAVDGSVNDTAAGVVKLSSVKDDEVAAEYLVPTLTSAHTVIEPVRPELLEFAPEVWLLA